MELGVKQGMQLGANPRKETYKIHYSLLRSNQAYTSYEYALADFSK